MYFYSYLGQFSLLQFFNLWVMVDSSSNIVAYLCIGDDHTQLPEAHTVALVSADQRFLQEIHMVGVVDIGVDDPDAVVVVVPNNNVFKNVMTEVSLDAWHECRSSVIKESGSFNHHVVDF